MASKWIVVINGSGNDFFGVNSSPSHYLNQYWHIIDWNLRKEFHWTFHQLIIIYYSRNYILRCRLQNVRHFAKAWNKRCDQEKFRMAPVGTGTLGYNLWFLSYTGQDNPVFMGWCNIRFGQESYSIGICQCWKTYSATGVFITAERFCVSEWRYSVYSCIHPCEEKKMKIDIFSIAKYELPFDLTLWGRVRHMCVSKQTIIGSCNGFSPCRQAERMPYDEMKYWMPWFFL